MTREEREAFVRRAWFGEGTAAEAITKIVDEWENQLDQVRDDARQERLGGD